MGAIYYFERRVMKLVGHICICRDFGYKICNFGYLRVDSSNFFGGHTRPVRAICRTETTVGLMVQTRPEMFPLLMCGPNRNVANQGQISGMRFRRQSSL